MAGEYILSEVMRRCCVAYLRAVGFPLPLKTIKSGVLQTWGIMNKQLFVGLHI
jgi:hypothetical protein